MKTKRRQLRHETLNHDLIYLFQNEMRHVFFSYTTPSWFLLHLLLSCDSKTRPQTLCSIFFSSKCFMQAVWRQIKLVDFIHYIVDVERLIKKQKVTNSRFTNIKCIQDINRYHIPKVTSKILLILNLPHQPMITSNI